MKTHGPFLFVVCILFGFSSSAQEYDLAYKFREGTSYRYTQSQTEKGYAQSQLGLNVEMNRNTEASFSVTVEQSSHDGFVLRIVQDTAIVVEKSPGAGSAQAPDIPNAITKKPVRITMTAKGQLRSAVPELPLRDSRLPAFLTESMLAQRAMIFAQLPTRSLNKGMSWTDAQSDTTRPMQDIQGVGHGEGLRYSTIHTLYEVEGMQKTAGYQCVTLSWKSDILVEAKMIYPGTDMFTEDRTLITGTLQFAPSEGLLVSMTVKTDMESTRVIYGKDSEISPSSTHTEMTLRLIK